MLAAVVTSQSRISMYGVVVVVVVVVVMVLVASLVGVCSYTVNRNEYERAGWSSD